MSQWCIWPMKMFRSLKLKNFWTVAVNEYSYCFKLRCLVKLLVNLIGGEVVYNATFIRLHGVPTTYHLKCGLCLVFDTTGIRATFSPSLRLSTGALLVKILVRRLVNRRMSGCPELETHLCSQATWSQAISRSSACK